MIIQLHHPVALLHHPRGERMLRNTCAGDTQDTASLQDWDFELRPDSSPFLCLTLHQDPIIITEDYCKEWKCGGSWGNPETSGRWE